MRSTSVPSLPATGSESNRRLVLVAARHRGAAGARSRYGDARLPRESPDPSTSCAPDPSRRAKPATSAAPAEVVPRPFTCIATSLASISAKKLSDGLFISFTIRSIGGESTLATTSRPPGALPASGLRRTGMPRASSARPGAPAANAGGLVWNALPPSLAKPRL